MLKALSPIRILVIYLIIMAVAATWSWSQTDIPSWLNLIRNFAVIYGSSWLTYQSLLWGGVAKPTRWENRLITSLILFLLFDEFLPWWIFLGLGVGSELLQRLIRTKTGPVFNPAAAVALVAAITGWPPGWWGMSFSPRLPLVEGGVSIAMLLTLPIAGYVVYAYKKWWIVGVAALVFGVGYWLAFQASPLFLLIEGTLAFFLLVMAVEPKTSPVLRNQQLVYGVVLGALGVVLLKLAFVESYVGALVVCNGGYALYRWYQLKNLQKLQAQKIKAPTL
jgi:Na+-translocating ferredoxin:NAD+ oxidoreductase RnfD subunit